MKLKEPQYKPQLGLFIYWSCIVTSIGGFIVGFDTVILTPAMVFFQDNEGMKPWSSGWKDAIFSTNLAMAALGAFLAGIISDTHGRKQAIMLGNIINTIGAIICCAAFEKWILLIGVIFLGVATGMASHTVPLYIAESCPSFVRGRFISNYQVNVNLGIMMAYVVGGAFSYIDPVDIGWRLMFAFAAVPSVIQFIGFLFLPQSPRFAFEKEGVEACEKVFEKIYEHNEDWIQYEIAELRVALERAKRIKALHNGAHVLFRIFSTPHLRKALFVGCVLQIFQQASGINTILYFTDTLFKSAGIIGNTYSIFLSVGPAAVFFITAFLPMYLVEVKGRRNLLLSSVIGLFISSIFMAGSFFMMNKFSAVVIKLNGSNVDRWTNISTENFNICNGYRNCDLCVTDQRCGFCSRQGEQNTQGYCLPIDPVRADWGSETGYCSSPTGASNHYHHINVTVGRMSLDTKYEWDLNFCHTQYVALPIVIALLHICNFSLGFAILPWLLNAEFYPLWARATCIAFSTFSDYAANLTVSLTYLSLSLAVTKYGLFCVYALIMLISLIFFIFIVPETKDVPMTEVEFLFMSKQEREKLHVVMEKEPKETLGETWKRIKKF